VGHTARGSYRFPFPQERSAVRRSRLLPGAVRPPLNAPGTVSVRPNCYASAFMRLAAPLTLFGTVAALCLATPEARGNGRFPAAQHVLVGPGTESRIIVLRTTFG